MDEVGRVKKKELRAEAMKRRGALTQTERAAKSSAICREIERSGLLQSARRVMVYAAVRGEVDLTELIEGLLGRGCRVAFPVIDVESKALSPVAVGDLAELQTGAFGIPTPPAGGAHIDPAALDAVVVPGLVFDRQGYRVGYGGGYYDRFLLRTAERAGRIGVVYHDLLLPTVPTEPFDQSVDWIVTEREIVGPL